MGIIDWLKGKSAPTERAPEERADVDWHELETALTRAIAGQVAEFAQSHVDEEFYGFAIDCNGYYANVLLCLNTPDALTASARNYAGTDAPEVIERQMADLRWGLGDWKYHGFNLDSPTWPDAVPMLEDFAELPSEADTEQFIETCCRALLAAERQGAFSPLKCTADFRVACIDHDEDLQGGDTRLARVRETL